ncbi:MAG: type II toxin-antitoxin system RelE/ParE family toxin [Rhodospirillales bacterium]|nr:type II toxin-antitoxin system RelE/ParE family toxin [Rhodospirillales bacterium]
MPNFKRLRISDPARKDLQRIGEYTRREWGVAQKRKYLSQIKDGFKEIIDTPGIGASRDDIAAGLRAFPVRKHIVFYRVTRNEVAVVRVLHASMSPDRHIGSRPERTLEN